MPDTIALTELPFPLLRRGKVRDVYDLGDALLLVATDRVSAFDVVMPDPIPRKGAVLNLLAAWWFGCISDVVPIHVLSVDPDQIIARYPVLASTRWCGRTVDARPEARALPGGVRRARVRSGSAGRSTGRPSTLAATSPRVEESANARLADLLPRHQARAATTRTSPTPAWRRSWRRHAALSATRASASTSGPEIAAERGSSSPTPSSSSGGRGWRDLRDRRGSPRLVALWPAAEYAPGRGSRRSTSSPCATTWRGSSRGPGQAARPRPPRLLVQQTSEPTRGLPAPHRRDARRGGLATWGTHDAARGAAPLKRGVIVLPDFHAGQPVPGRLGDRLRLAREIRGGRLAHRRRCLRGPLRRPRRRFTGTGREFGELSTRL